MSSNPITFVNEWIEENLYPVAYPQENDPEIKELAERCLSDAAKVGITKEEIEREMGTLEDIIHEEWEKIIGSEVDRLASRDD